MSFSSSSSPPVPKDTRFALKFLVVAAWYEQAKGQHPNIHTPASGKTTTTYPLGEFALALWRLHDRLLAGAVGDDVEAALARRVLCVVALIALRALVVPLLDLRHQPLVDRLLVWVAHGCLRRDLAQRQVHLHLVLLFVHHALVPV